MLFRAISGLIHLTSGQVDVFGQRIGVDVDFPRSLGPVSYTHLNAEKRLTTMSPEVRAAGPRPLGVA